MKRLLLIVSLFSISLSEAKFPFKVWKGVEKSLKKIGLKSEDLHPALGKFYYDILSNLRLMSGLYEKGEKNKEIPIESEIKDFASLLQMLFPSNAGIFMPSSDKCEIIYHFSPRDFGAVVKAIYTNKTDELEKILSECLNRCQSEILEKKKKDIQFNAQKDNKDKTWIEQQNEKAINNSKKEVEKKRDDLIKIIKNTKKYFDSQSHFPKNLTEITFLALFWERYSTYEDMKGFLEGMGEKNFKECTENESITDMMELITGHPYLESNSYGAKNKKARHEYILRKKKEIKERQHTFENDARVFLYENEVLNSFAYPEKHKFTWNSQAEYKDSDDKLIAKFSDCVESSLMQNLDLVLCDGFFKTDHMKESPLKEFYESRKEKGTTPTTAWLKVTENLDLGDKTLFYNESKNNNYYNIRSGIIRIICIISNISKFDSDFDYLKIKNLKKEDREENAKQIKEKCEKWFVSFFESIDPKKRKFLVTIDDFQWSDYKKSGKDFMKDFLGDIKIQILENNKKVISWIWHINSGHSYVNDFFIEKSSERNFKKQVDHYIQKTPFSIFRKDTWFLNMFKNSLVNNVSNQIEWLKTEKPDEKYESLWKTTLQKILSILNFSDEETFFNAKENIIKNKDIISNSFFINFIQKIDYLDYFDIKKHIKIKKIEKLNCFYIDEIIFSENDDIFTKADIECAEKLNLFALKNIEELNIDTLHEEVLLPHQLEKMSVTDLNVNSVPDNLKTLFVNSINTEAELDLKNVETLCVRYKDLEKIKNPEKIKKLFVLIDNENYEEEKLNITNYKDITFIKIKIDISEVDIKELMNLLLKEKGHLFTIAKMALRDIEPNMKIINGHLLTLMRNDERIVLISE